MGVDAGLAFEEVASPFTFVHEPRLAWGFTSHVDGQVPEGRSRHAPLVRAALDAALQA